MQAEILLTLKLQQRLFADPRRIELLKQIRITGSISQGAKLAGISYKSAWDAINEMNQLSEHSLVDRATGGKGGGGARITRYGDRLIQLFGLLEKIQQKAFDVLQDDSMPLDSLLAAIARFSLQTSARNQYFGSVIQNDGESILQHIDILLADGSTQLRAAITQQSAERLRLIAGQDVIALIKAPWITLAAAHSTNNSFDNQLEGTVASIQPGDDNSEVLVTLNGGETLCATVLNSELKQLKCKVGQSIVAQFSADKVIVATLC